MCVACEDKNLLRRRNNTRPCILCYINYLFAAYNIAPVVLQSDFSLDNFWRFREPYCTHRRAARSHRKHNRTTIQTLVSWRISYTFRTSPNRAYWNSEKRETKSHRRDEILDSTLDPPRRRQRVFINNQTEPGRFRSFKWF